MAKIYNWDKALREEKSRKNPRNPSFSSILLDEIYRSIDGVEENNGEIKLQREKSVKIRQSIHGGGGGGRGKSSSTVEGEEMASFRRACLVEKWMEKKVNGRVSGGGVRPKGSSLPEFDRRSVLDNDPLYFSSSSSSSDSSFGFNEPDVFDGAKSKPQSCFAPFRPKSVNTTVNPPKSGAKQNEFYLFDDCRNHQTNKTEDSLIKSKARAAKIYESLKKVKQPISPGGRLTSFLNSIFTNGNGKKGKDKKGKDLNSSVDFEDSKMERKTKSIQEGSTCSSASSFSRSCLSKNSPRSREKLNNGIKRTVRFYPVSVIVDEDSRPCGRKIIYDEQSDRQRNVDIQLQLLVEKNKKEFSRNYPNQKENKFLGTNADVNEDDDNDDDMESDASSDLFELDHLTDFKDDRFCEELPVYETTHLGRNRAIASGLIR